VNPFKVLHDQVKGALLKEASLTPEERKIFQWQFLATVAGVTYLVGKGGANTMFYRLNDEEMQYKYPDEMLEIVKSWLGEKYSSYSLYKGKKKGKKSYASLKQIKDKVPSNYSANLYIVGETKEGTKTRLFKLHDTLEGLKWMTHDK